MAEDREDLLSDARNRAERLLANLLQLKVDLRDTCANGLDVDQQQVGQARLQQVVIAVEHTIAALEAAIRDRNVR